MPAVPPCLTEKIRSLCRVPSHSLPVTPALRLGYLANTVHLALGGPFTETASIRITPPRTLWETVPQFYFLVFGLFLFSMVIYYHLSFVLSTIFKKLFCVFSQIIYLKQFSYMSTKPVTKSACLLASSLPPVTCQP